MSNFLGQERQREAVGVLTRSPLTNLSAPGRALGAVRGLLAHDQFNLSAGSLTATEQVGVSQDN